MKKISVIILSFICVFALTACSKNEDVNNNNNNNESQNNNYTENIEDIVKDAALENDLGDENESGDASMDIGLYSTENRAVFNFGNAYYLIYDFDGEKVTGLSYYYTYEDEKTAKLSYDYFKEALDNKEMGTESIKEAYYKDNHVILIAKEELYNETTKQEVMDAYSYLEQVYDEALKTSGDLSE